MARLSRTDAFLTQQFSYFLDQLLAVKDGEEALLDRTIVLFGSGMSYGHSHGNANLPTILACGTALGFKHGKHIDYNLPIIKAYDVTKAGEHYNLCHKPVDGKARLSNLLLTMMQKMDVKAETFVDSLGPISELTARQAEVLSEVARGKSNRAIAEIFGITKKSVEHHIAAIFNRLDLSDEKDVSRRVAATLLHLRATLTHGSPAAPSRRPSPPPTHDSRSSKVGSEARSPIAAPAA